jgi:hypothetical protein
MMILLVSPAFGALAAQSIARPAAMRAAASTLFPRAISDGVGGENLSMRRRLRASSSVSRGAELDPSGPPAVAKGLTAG